MSTTTNTLLLGSLEGFADLHATPGTRQTQDIRHDNPGTASGVVALLTFKLAQSGQKLLLQPADDVLGAGPCLGLFCHTGVHQPYDPCRPLLWHPEHLRPCQLLNMHHALCLPWLCSQVLTSAGIMLAVEEFVLQCTRSIKVKPGRQWCCLLTVSSGRGMSVWAGS